MLNGQKFQAFFSYAHSDGLVDPSIIRSFTAELQDRVNARLTNASFSIWIDSDRLKTGYRWDARILEAIRESHILITLLTPKWIESDYCRKEFAEFLQIEAGFEIGEYIAPILARTLQNQLKHFTQEQREIYNAINERQYAKSLSRDFIVLTPEEKSLLLENLADDVEGMIDRLRAISKETRIMPPVRQRASRQPAEYNSQAHNFEYVELLRSAEVEIEAPNELNMRAVFAHIGFTPRMYVQTSNIRVEFGIRRALLSIETEVGAIDRIEEWDVLSEGKSAYYVRTRDNPDVTTLCINPLPGSDTLQELPLPPSPGENRFSKIASATADVDHRRVSAILKINLSPEGLYVFGEPQSKPSAALLKKISAIANIAIQKELTSDTKRLEQNIMVRERKR